MFIHISIDKDMTMQPAQFFKCLADETRLRCLILLQRRGELCVCELTKALQMSQPKISRHLALLRTCRLLQDRRQGAWVYYRLHPALPDWALAVLTTAAESLAGESMFMEDAARLTVRAACPTDWPKGNESGALPAIPAEGFI
jgi:ArsR family transcriptional regulator